MLRVQQATGPPDGWNVMVDGELAWVQEHLRRTGQPVFPPQAVATLRLLPPMHQVLCVARLREASRLDPGQRLHRRILAFQRMYKTGEVPDDSDTEAPPHTGGTDQRATAAERSAASSAAPAEPTPPQRPCPRPPPGPSELEPPREAEGHESRWWQGRQHICLSTAIASRVRHVFMCLCVRHVRHVRHVFMCACMCALACMENAMVRGLRAFSPGQLRTQCFFSFVASRTLQRTTAQQLRLMLMTWNLRTLCDVRLKLAKASRLCVSSSAMGRKLGLCLRRLQKMRAKSSTAI
jgi:hypothetical protein